MKLEIIMSFFEPILPFEAVMHFLEVMSIQAHDLECHEQETQTGLTPRED